MGKSCQSPDLVEVASRHFTAGKLSRVAFDQVKEYAKDANTNGDQLVDQPEHSRFMREKGGRLSGEAGKFIQACLDLSTCQPKSVIVPRK